MREIKSENPRKVKIVIVLPNNKDAILSGTNVYVYDAETGKPLPEVQGIGFSFNTSIDDIIENVGKMIWFDFEKLHKEYGGDHEKFFADPDSEVEEVVEVVGLEFKKA